jgi:hypothetical protein
MIRGSFTMKIPVLVQSENSNGFRAELLPSAALIGEGSTPEAAMDKLREAIQTRIDQGAKIAYVELEEVQNPWLQLVGVYKDDPYLNDYLQALADYRKQVDDDPDRV